MHSPEADEIEITVLGRGVGESVVVHLGHRRWLIVDSFTDPAQGIPVGQAYLDSMGVGRDDVESIVITHFHTDHYRDVDRLHDYYRRARLVITDALKHDEFLTLYNDEADDAPLDMLPATIKRASARRIGRVTSGLLTARAGQNVITAPNVSVRALSPTIPAVEQSARELAAAFRAGESRAMLRSRLKDDNRCSVVLQVSVGPVNALLCADLIADHHEFGWYAVLDEPNHANLPASDFVKVGHHGSSNAHDPAMWESLVSENPILAVTPYWSSRIPKQEDLDRLCRLGRVWQAAPSSRFVTNEFGHRLSTRAETGTITARRRVDELEWRVSCAPPAFFVGPPTAKGNQLGNSSG